MRLLQSEYWTIYFFSAHAFVWVRRSPLVCQRAEDVEAAFGGLLRAVHPFAGRELSVMVDLRNGPMRNDPEFEKISLPYHQEFSQIFPSIAFIVRSAVGRQQINRYNRGSKAVGAGSFQSLEDGLAFLGLDASLLDVLRPLYA